MIKIIKITLFCLAILFFLPLVSSAETGSSTLNNKNPRPNNNDIRNTIAEQRNERREKISSTTTMFKTIKDQKRTVALKMKENIFQIRKMALERELHNALNNLMRIRNQISDRIVKIESNNEGTTTLRDMTEAKKALIIADDKLAKAKTAVELFTNTVFTKATSTISTTTELSLDKPRKIGDDAIKAVKDARDSLKKVTQLIAHGMGLKVGQMATTTRN